MSKPRRMDKITDSIVAIITTTSQASNQAGHYYCQEAADDRSWLYFYVFFVERRLPKGLRNDLIYFVGRQDL